MLKNICVLFLAGCLMLCPHQLLAQDDVLSTIEEAVKQYQAGDFAGAASNLDYASQLVRQKKSETMKGLLPEALPGWKAEEATAQAVGADILGGGLTVSREYKKGPSRMSVEIVADSPVLKSVLMMINNPMFAGVGGGKLETIKEQRAIIKYNHSKKNGDAYIVVDGRFLITVKGSGIERKELLQYADAIDFPVLVKSK